MAKNTFPGIKYKVLFSLRTLTTQKPDSGILIS